VRSRDERSLITSLPEKLQERKPYMKRTESFHDGWLFHKGDIPQAPPLTKAAAYLEAKTEQKRCGPAAKDYADGAVDSWENTGLLSHDVWEKVTVPHDYVISGTPDASLNGAWGYLPYPNAWYRKHFTLPAEDAGRRICICFEAVAIHCTVYVNGIYMLTNRCGYTPFEVDISDVVLFGEDNVIALRISCDEHEGWWYEGAGITRNVTLEVSEPVSVERDGVFVHPEKDHHTWRVPVDIEIRNDARHDTRIRASCRILSPDGKETAVMEQEELLPKQGHHTLHLCGQVTTPLLWDTENPALYTLETVLYADGEPVDKRRDRFGFRTIRFDPEAGFFLNDRRVEIKGICNHADLGLTGRAVPERLQKKRLEMLREMGANAFRCAHYPHPAYTMDLLDEMGFLVMAETRWFSTAPESMAQLAALVRRNRNHPGIILWSAGNEEPLHLTDQGRRIARGMMERIRELDGTRPVTTAVSHDPAHAAVADLVDVMGVNYNLTHFDLLHKKYPELPLVSSENTATSTTRGWYREDSPERGYMNAFDHTTSESFLSRETTWKYIMDRPWIAGGFQWDGTEHRGETTWPRLCSQAGAIDLFLQKKEAFYVNQALWTEKPMIFLAPHWNWQGLEGETLRVTVYTNCSEVTLRLNGKTVGTAAVQKYGHAEWDVPYEPGKLEAWGIIDGHTVCRMERETTGMPVRLRLRCETGSACADGCDVILLTCECLDAEERTVPDASPLVRFSCNGLGSIIATGSDVCDHVPVPSPIRRMREGAISVLIRAGTSPGLLKVWAEAEGLGRAVCMTKLRSSPGCD